MQCGQLTELNQLFPQETFSYRNCCWELKGMDCKAVFHGKGFSDLERLSVLMWQFPCIMKFISVKFERKYIQYILKGNNIISQYNLKGNNYIQYILEGNVFQYNLEGNIFQSNLKGNIFQEKCNEKNAMIIVPIWKNPFEKLLH